FGGGLTVRVHSRALAAFNRVASNLAAAGNTYGTRSGETFGFTARTVTGTRSISYHAFGAAVDINSRSNPTASSLITDMPEWYVNAWRQAGFCWGGDWVGNKDAMHYSWMGPAATPGYGPVPAPYPSLASRASFAETVAVPSSALGSRQSGAIDALADLTGDGAVDVVRIRQHPVAGPTLEITGSWADFGMCGFSRFQLPGAPVGQQAIFGNTAFGGRPDIAFAASSGGRVELRIFQAKGFYQDVRTVSTGAAADASATLLLADYNSDGRADLYKISGSELEIWDAGSGYGALLLSTGLPAGGGQVMIGERDLDGIPDLYRLAQDGTLHVLLASSNYGSVAESISVPLSVGSEDIFRVSDFDGDGNGDLYRLNSSGAVAIALGNQQIYSDIDGWFRAPDFECEDPPAYNFVGRFGDDDQNPFAPDIEWAAAEGITIGCNPPFNDWFCPRLPVTRAQMATFLVRALDLPAASQDFFGDDSTSSHQADINSLAAAGVTTGCTAGSYCPELSVTREQMASFLVRAFDLPTGATNPFADVGGTHAADIAAIHEAGITTGCSLAPLSYCPGGLVLREQMAAFLHRASD
ncbi:MAG: M15 family metallopeptidase, partial [Acidimicrobiia bacterium]